jgi:SCP1.201-like deaminase
MASAGGGANAISGCIMQISGISDLINGLVAIFHGCVYWGTYQATGGAIQILLSLAPFGAGKAGSEIIGSVSVDTEGAIIGRTGAAAAADVVPELPAFVTGGKARGVLVRPDGRATDIVSGMDGPALGLPKPRAGMNGTIVGHVEAHASAIMRTEHLDQATLWINRMPCPGHTGCMINLSRMVPTGAEMTIYVMPGGSAGPLEDVIIVTGTG